MHQPARLIQRIASRGLILLAGGALLLPACAKNSGSFQASNIGAVTSTPVPSSPSAEDSQFKTKIQIQPAPTTPPEFRFQSTPTVETRMNGEQLSYEKYRAMRDQEEKKTTPEEVVKSYPLAWESPSHPERKNWSTYTAQVVDAQFENLDQATDAVLFCPNYTLLEKKYKEIFWQMLISEITFHESAWNPTARSRESSMGIDGVTKAQVFSEGLMQLSYQDTQWSSYCRFDWSKDRTLSAKDPQKTIFNPYLNLSCGIRILAEQVARKKLIVMRSNIYWSVLHQDGKYSKVKEMTEAIRRRLDFCN